MSVDLVILVLVGQTSFVTTLWRQAVLRGHFGRRSVPSWLRDDNDDDKLLISRAVERLIFLTALVR